MPMTLDDYKQMLKSRLKEKRYYHSLCVADEAARLAQKYGGSPEKAYLAGLLHDICKNDCDESLLQTLDKFGIILNNIEKSSPKLWHAMAGAAFVQHELGISDGEIISAIRYHTTARSNMSLMEKILYLADYTSADRNYDGIGDMRSAVNVSLKTAMETALVFTITDLAEQHRPIHPDTINAYNETMMEK